MTPEEIIIESGMPEDEKLLWLEILPTMTDKQIGRLIECVYMDFNWINYIKWKH